MTLQKVTCTNNCQHAINLRSSQFAIRSIQYSYTFNKISSKAKVLRQRSTEDNFMEMSLPQHEDLIPDLNSSLCLQPLNHISRNIAPIITTNRWLYAHAINCAPNNEKNKLRIARITLCDKVQKTPIQFVIYRTSAWNCRQVITAKLIWQFPNSSQTIPPSRAVLRDFITIQIP